MLGGGLERPVEIEPKMEMKVLFELLFLRVHPKNSGFLS